MKAKNAILLLKQMIAEGRSSAKNSPNKSPDFVEGAETVIKILEESIEKINSSKSTLQSYGVEVQ